MSRIVTLRWIRILVFCLASALAGSAVSFAAPPGRPAVQSSEHPVANAVRVNRAPKLDGTLNDPIWQQAKPITAFLQREPHEGEPATEKTEVRILYTNKEIYFGIYAHDPNPRSIVASDLRRDSRMNSDDYFEILIDPTNSQRNAYIFEFNALGTQRDGLVREGGRAGFGWNGIWTSSARIVPDGWTATIGIPFFTLNLIHSQQMVWGINFLRFIRAKNEQDLWASWRRQYGLFELSQEGTLEGLNGINGGRLLVLKPYAITGFRHLPASAAGSSIGSPGMNMRHKAGISGRIGLHSNVVANFTANTSFATAAANRTQFSLSPYPLFFPETRQFFLENSSIFSFPISFVPGGPGGGGPGGGGPPGGRPSDLLFFSRQIGIDSSTGEQVPLNGGAKLTGTMGKYDFGAMDVETRAKGTNPHDNFAVLSLKRSIFGSSYVGIMAIDKRTGSSIDRFNQAGGVDTRLLIHKNIAITGFVAATRTPGLVGQNSDVGAGIQYTTDWFDVGAGRRKVGANFNPEVGFLQRNNCLCNTVAATLRPRPNIPGVREVDIGGNFSHDSTTTGVLETQNWRGNVQVRFDNGSFFGVTLANAHAQQINDTFNIYKNIEIQPGLYRWMAHQIQYGSPQNWPFTFNVSYNFGTYYDGHLNQYHAGFNYRLNEHWNLGLNQQWNRFRLPEGDFSVVFGGLNVNYAFSRFFTVSAVTQMNTARTHAVTSNIILRWRYRPDSDFYMVYTSGPRFAAQNGSSTTIDQNQLIFGFNYSFNPCRSCKLGSSGRHSQLADNPVTSPRPPGNKRSAAPAAPRAIPAGELTGTPTHPAGYWWPTMGWGS